MVYGRLAALNGRKSVSNVLLVATSWNIPKKSFSNRKALVSNCQKKNAQVHGCNTWLHGYVIEKWLLLSLT